MNMTTEHIREDVNGYLADNIELSPWVYLDLSIKFWNEQLVFYQFIFGMAQGKVLPQEKSYPEKKSTPEEVYPGKNPQFLSNLYETWWKYSSSECFKFLQYQLDWIKIVDFFQGWLFPG